MTGERVLDLFRVTGALLEGHFIYTSGRHGRQFLQAARLMQHPKHTEAVCRAIAERFATDKIDLVVGPATGGIALAHETARHLGCRFAYSEKDGADGMAIKRGFANPAGCRAMVVEDIITTGGSVQKTIDHLQQRGAEVMGVGAIIDRSGGKARFTVRFESLAGIAMESWAPEDCPLCKAGQPLVEPDDIVL